MMETTLSRNKRQRNSNIESFRIVAMFLVLVVHAGFFSLSIPTDVELTQSPLSTVARFFFQSLSIGCVDMFVLISGWFGIRPKIKNFSSFIFQCLFFLIGIYLLCVAIGLSSFDLTGVYGCFFLLKWNWFIKAYIGLYILSPVLNAYIDHSTEKQLRMTLISFYVFQSIYYWYIDAAVFFESGYSTMSFIGLYLLARYVRLYPLRLTMFKPQWDFSIFGSIIVIQTLIAIGLLSVGREVYLDQWVFSYVSPIVIVSLVYALLGFSKLNFQSKLVNWVAASSFAVFLLHTQS